MAAQGYSRNPEVGTVLSEYGPLSEIEHQICNHDVDRAERCRCLGPIGADFDSMTAIGKDAGDEFTNSPVGFSYKNSRHQ